MREEAIRIGAAPHLGAQYLGEGRTEFCVWAPHRDRIELKVLAPVARTVVLTPGPGGYHSAVVEKVGPGARYYYRLSDGLERPDPASRAQPEGVHGPSAVIEPSWDWEENNWIGLPLRDYAIYELHVGTFTAEGTFAAIIPWLPRLRELGVTAIELMPVAQFPGARNWGYDGVFPFAVQHSYGGVTGLRGLVQAAHQHGLAVVLDVVYNHLGPEGNYLGEYGPYFTDRYKTPWGSALNLDGAESDGVRHYLIENALYWQRDCHLDALRLDAVHAICDFSAVPFLEELAAVTQGEAKRLNRRFFLIAETDQNDVRLILPRALTGYGLDAQWSDDFHHALHVLLTGEQSGYYQDFGGIGLLARVYREGYAYSGQYSKHRRRRHGNSPHLARARQFVVCSQNHDQIGNRPNGDRLSTMVSFEAAKLAAGAMVLSPFIPMLFMGEEYGERAPFQYFTSHTDPALVEAVRQGRKAEHAAFASEREIPDPQASETFERCRLDQTLRHRGQHQVLERFYAELFKVRRDLLSIARAEKESCHVMEFEHALALHYRFHAHQCWVLLCFANDGALVELPLAPGHWKRRLDSAATTWNGPGSAGPLAFVADGLVKVRVEPCSVTLLEMHEQ